MKIVPPHGSNSSLRYRAAVQNAAIEKKEAAYIPLKCGHMTTWESVVFYSIWQPKGKYYCENCGRWVKKRPARINPPSSGEPLF